MKFLFKSIRWRVQAWHGLMLLAVLTAFGGSAYYFSKESRFRAIDQHLQRRVFFVSGTALPASTRETLREALRDIAILGRFEGPMVVHRMERADRPGPAERFERPERIERFDRFERIAPWPPEPPGPNRFRLTDPDMDLYYHIAWNADGTVLDQSSTVPPGLSMPEATATITSRFRTRGEYREHVIVTPAGPRLVVGRSIARELDDLSRLAWLLIAAGATVLTLGLAGGWWLATRAIRPIQAISDTAGKIAAGNFAERIDISDTDNELGRLALTLNATFTRLQEAFDDQARAYERQAQFTADASHELRTPVSVVLTQAQSTLARERSPAEYRDALEVCQRAADRMRRLVESLLTLARLDSHAARAAADSCELGRITREAADLLRPIAAQHQVALRLEVRTATCLGDASQLGQVVTNLIGNAIHYNRPGGEVRISVGSDRNPAFVALSVSDTGHGIAPHDLPHIFERFYRADKARRGNGHVGLGLAIAQAIVTCHGGTIDATSASGRGSTFTVRLPAHRALRYDAAETGVDATPVETAAVAAQILPRK